MFIRNRDIDAVAGACIVLSELLFENWSVVLKIADIRTILKSRGEEYQRALLKINEDYSARDENGLITVKDESGTERTQIDSTRFFDYQREATALADQSFVLDDKLCITQEELATAKVRVKKANGDTTKETWSPNPEVIAALGPVFKRSDDSN